MYTADTQPFRLIIPIPGQLPVTVIAIARYSDPKRKFRKSFTDSSRLSLMFRIKYRAQKTELPVARSTPRVSALLWLNSFPRDDIIYTPRKEMSRAA